jgi:hypothetical protein
MDQAFDPRSPGRPIVWQFGDTKQPVSRFEVSGVAVAADKVNTTTGIGVSLADSVSHAAMLRGGIVNNRGKFKALGW